MTNKKLETMIESLEELVVDSQEATHKSLQGLQQVIEGLVSFMSTVGTVQQFLSPSYTNLLIKSDQVF